MTRPYDDRQQAAMVRLDGVHALKHALRFGADVQRIVTDNKETARRSVETVAADVAETVMGRIEVVADLSVFTDQPHSTRLVSFARRPEQPIRANRQRPGIILEAPRHLSNLGAAIRVAAGADASVVATTGNSDPWHPTSVRTSAGLHFALPVVRYESVPAAKSALGAPLVGLDPDHGTEDFTSLGPAPLFCFGTERAGLSADARNVCDALVRIPMRAGVSSLNLATSVAIVLYHYVDQQSG